jgi:hypothetical protein
MPARRRTRRALACAALACAAFIAGCAGVAPSGGRGAEPAAEPVPAPVNLSGYNATFKQGYADGCASAGASRRRDEARFKTEMDYQMGWNDGFAVCGKRR